MKFLRNLTTYAVATVFALLVATGAFVSTAAAGSPVFNNHPNDNKTLRVVNVTDNPGCSGCWTGSTSADIGEKVEVYLYFHNNGTAPATGTRLRIQEGPVSNTGNFTGRITATNWSGQENDTAYVNIPSNAYLEFIPGSSRYYTNVQENLTQNLSSSQEQSIFSSSGFLAGTVNNGPFNGALIVAYRVMGGNNGGGNDELEIETLNATNIDEDSATLRGEVVEASTGADVWFYWSTVASDVTVNCNADSCPNANFLSVPSPSGGFDEGDTFSRNLGGLNDNDTYFYRACGELANGQMDDCGIVKQFTTDSNNNGGGNDDQTIIETQSATNIDEDSATLRGEVDLTESEAEVWFRWSDDEDDLNPSNGTGGNYLSVSGMYGTGEDFDRTVTGLDDNTTYYYMACGRDEDTNDLDCGSIRDFETDDDNNNNNNGDDDLRIDTLTATNIDTNSARLRGEVDQAAGDEVEVWFEWSDDEDIVEDGDGVVRQVSGDYSEGDDFDREISGLAPGTRYYFRACGYDPDTDGDDEDCGTIRSFITDGGSTPSTGGPGTVAGILPSVVTITANDITATGATLAGGFNSNTSCDVTTGYFQYGRTTALGNNSTTVAINDTKGVFFQRIEGLTPGVTYFYRAQAVNCNGLGVGALRSFRTVGAVSVPSTPVTPVVTTPVVVSTGEGDGLINLLIDDHLDTVVNGQVSTYEVNWENIANFDLDRLEIEVQLPNEGKFLSTTRGQYNEDNHTVFIEIDDLEVDEDGEAFITMEIRDTRGTETLVVASAVAVFENPDTGARANAIDFDDTQLVFGGSNLGASIFGNGFWPVTLLGWLFLLLILFVLFVAARYIAMRQAPRPVYYAPVPQNNAYAPYQPAPRN